MHLRTGSGSPGKKIFSVRWVNGMAKVPKIPLNYLKQLFRAHQALIAKAGEQTNPAIPFDFNFTANQKFLPKKWMLPPMSPRRASQSLKQPRVTAEHWFFRAGRDKCWEAVLAPVHSQHSWKSHPKDWTALWTKMAFLKRQTGNGVTYLWVFWKNLSIKYIISAYNLLLEILTNEDWTKI